MCRTTESDSSFSFLKKKNLNFDHRFVYSGFWMVTLVQMRPDNTRLIVIIVFVVSIGEFFPFRDLGSFERLLKITAFQKQAWNWLDL